MPVKLKEKNDATVSVQGQKARIRLLSEGVGSSATYPGEILERDGALAFPAGTHLFWDHLTESEEWDRGGTHSIKDLIGVTLTEAQYVPDEKALYADANFFAAASPLIAEAKDYVGLSIEASAVVNAEGVLEALIPSPYNAIAVVPRAGRDGKITELLESYRETEEYGKIITEAVKTAEDTRKDKGMTPEDIEKVAEAVAKAITPALTDIKEALTPAKPAVEPAEVDEVTVDHAAVTEALIESGLTASARKRVFAALDADPSANVADLIEAEKAFADEVLKESAEANPGRVRESSTNSGSGTDFTVGW